MVKRGDRWLIASFHYSTNVFENPILDRYRSMYVPIGAAALVAGLIVGWFLGRMIGRRRTTT